MRLRICIMPRHDPGTCGPGQNNCYIICLVAHARARRQVEDYFTRLIQRVAPKHDAQARAEVVVTRRFLENFSGDQARWIIKEPPPLQSARRLSSPISSPLLLLSFPTVFMGCYQSSGCCRVHASCPVLASSSPSFILSSSPQCERLHAGAAGAVHCAVLQRGRRPHRADQPRPPVAVRAGRADYGALPSAYGARGGNKHQLSCTVLLANHGSCTPW